MKNAYEILGVNKDATDDQIRAAWREKARELHPDRNKRPTATQEYEEAKKSYDILKDPSLRADHDFALVRAKGASIPADALDDSLADWFTPAPQPAPSHRQAPRRVPAQPQRQTRHHDRRMDDETIPDGFLDDTGYF